MLSYKGMTEGILVISNLKKLYNCVVPTKRHHKIKSVVLRRMVMFFFLSFYMITHPTVIFKVRRMVIYPYVEIVVTTRCTLRCKDCANLMQYYTCSEDEPIETLLDDLQKLLDSVDFIETFRIIGGEPLLRKDIRPLIEMAIASPKIKEVAMHTNGTIVPGKDLLELFHNKKFKLSISNYGKYSTKKDVLAGMGFSLSNDMGEDESSFWDYYGPVEKREGVLDEELKEQHKRCGFQCYSFFKGTLSRCPRIGHGVDLGLIPRIEGEYIDIRNESDAATLRHKHAEFLKKELFEACKYCYKGTDKCVKIPGGVQTG